MRGKKELDEATSGNMVSTKGKKKVNYNTSSLWDTMIQHIDLTVWEYLQVDPGNVRH